MILASQSLTQNIDKSQFICKNLDSLMTSPFNNSELTVSMKELCQYNIRLLVFVSLAYHESNTNKALVLDKSYTSDIYNTINRIKTKYPTNQSLISLFNNEIELLNTYTNEVRSIIDMNNSSKLPQTVLKIDTLFSYNDLPITPPTQPIIPKKKILHQSQFSQLIFQPQR